VRHVHNALHRCTDLLQGFKRSLGMDTDADAVERLGETLTPVMDLWSRPEWALPRREYLGWAYQLTGAGGAGIRSLAGIRNISTVDDQWLVTIEPGTQAYQTTAGVMVASISLTDATDAKGVASRDGRWPSDIPMVRVRSQAVALPAGIDQGAGFLGNEPASATTQTRFEMRQPAVIRCGQAFYLYPGADNVEVYASFFVRSRRCFPGEHLQGVL